MKTIASIIRLIVFSNIFISLCVLCFTAKTALILFGDNGNIHVNLLAFFSTFFLYGFHGIYGSSYSETNECPDNQRRTDDYRRLNMLLNPLAFAFAVSQLIYMPLRVWFILIPVAAIAFGYSIPIIRRRNKFLRLRDISWYKAVWIAFSYAWLATCLPIAFILPLNNLLRPQVIFIFLRNFLFIFAIAIPFDIRDVRTDLHSGIRTLPLLLGIKGSIKIALILLFAFVLSAILQVYMHDLSIPIFLALLISGIEAAIVIPLSSPKKPTLFFPIAIESSMVLQWALLYVFLMVRS